MVQIKIQISSPIIYFTFIIKLNNKIVNKNKIKSNLIYIINDYTRLSLLLNLKTMTND